MYNYKIMLPNGGYKMVAYESQEDKMPIAAAVMAEWEDYCDNNWLSPNHEDRFCGEANVKRFMESVSNFLLRYETDDVITPYKQKRNAESEVLIPNNHDGVVCGVSSEIVQEAETAPSAFLSKGRYKSKEEPTETVFTRIQKVKKTYPTMKMTVSSVNTDGEFRHAGDMYSISKSVPQYCGRETKSGTRYDMDRVLCGTVVGGECLFFDQYGVQIDKYNVKVVNITVDTDKAFSVA